MKLLEEFRYTWRKQFVGSGVRGFMSFSDTTQQFFMKPSICKAFTQPVPHFSEIFLSVC